MFLAFGDISATAQILPNFNSGPNGFAQVDFAQIYLDQINHDAKKSAQQKAQDKERIDSGVVSALDLEAPNNAVEQYNRASTLLKAQNSKEAIKYLQRAIHDYPKFVAAYMALGQAYVDQEDPGRAKDEFEMAAKLDGKFPGSFLNLGRLALSLNDFPAAQSELEKAAAILPKDPKILSTLAYAQNGTHQYRNVLETVERVHAVDHKGMANVHYVAAAAAMAIQDYDAMERQLNFLLSEDPTNAFAPVARQNLAALTHNKAVRAEQGSRSQPAPTLVASQSVTFPNTDRLKAQLNGLGNESDGGPCDAECVALAEANTSAAAGGNGSPASNVSPVPASRPRGVWTVRTSVDDVAVFFSVSSHGHMINDLEQSDIKIRDDNKPPKKIMQFLPQAKLPLRLALLVDTSGSVHDRFSFEKHAAANFVEKILNGTSDLGFVEGFATEPTVTQDFSAQPAELGNGIEKLANGGGTALFDAVAFACGKLAAYPENTHVARVLVILSDGEDNSSHSTLKQSIQASERAGVTIYTISTREDRGDKTDADRILEALAENSGGEAMFPGDVFTLNRSFDKLHDLIRSRYFIAYKPADFQPNGSYRAISIVAEKSGKHLQVRARKGYHARLEASPN
ncbi:MAG TPA: VWA domain-containing protein [Candidatus Eremiobacteraceae bacterium]|nr:VWA domain-containing protein [Candidatus Eremiobacteraceae bacterium]